MKQQETSTPVGKEADDSATVTAAHASFWQGHLVYRELADVPVQVVDPLDELSRSMNQLEDMQARMRFMMREIRMMMKA